MALSAQEVAIILKAQDQASASIAKVSGELTNLGNQGSSMGSKLQSAGTALAGIAATAAVAGIAALGAGFVAAANSAATFEKQMSAISAVSGASAAEMDQLKTAALDLGAKTSFSAKEAAEGIEELVKAGVSVGDVLGGAAAASLNLAAAGGIKVGEAAEIASNAMNVFGLKGADMAHVADVIAGAANSSAISVTDYKFSLAAAGAVAATVGIGFDDLSTAIGVMGNAGIKGSDAGTSLKTMLLNLTPSTKAQIAVAKELGIVTKDGANQFFDASGKAKSMAEIAQVLQTATKGLTDQQKLQALQTLFGTDAIRAAAVMAKEGAAGFEEMAASIGKVTAEAVAAERLNNLAGDIEQLTGSIDTASILIGEAFQPALRSMTQAATELVNTAGPQIADFAEQAAMGIVEGSRQMADAWRTVQQVFADDWEPEEGIDEFVIQVGLAAAAVRDAIRWFQSLRDAVADTGAFNNLARAVNSLATDLEVAGGQVRFMAYQIDRLNEAAGGDSILSLASAVKVVAVAFELWALSMGQGLDIIMSFANQTLAFMRIVGNLGVALKSLATGDTKAYEEAMQSAAIAMLDLMNGQLEFSTRTTARAASAWQAIAGSAVDGMAETTAAVEGGMSESQQAASTAFEAMASSADADLGAMAANATAQFDLLAAGVGTSMGEASAAVEAQVPVMVAATDAMGTGMAGSLEAASPAMAAAAEVGASSAVAAVQGQTGAASAAGASVGDSMGAGLQGGILAWAGRVAAAAADLVSSALGAARAEADSHSPSKKTEQLGKDLADGLEIGLSKANIGATMVAQIRTMLDAARDYVPTAREIARVEGEIKDIRDAAQTASLFRGQDMITVESELLRLKRDQAEAEQHLLPIRQDLADAEREIRDISAGSLSDRSELLEFDTQRKQLRLQSLDLEKQLLTVGKDEGRRKQIQGQIDALRDQDRALGIEQDRIRTTNDLAATAARRRALGLGEILTAQERSTEGIVKQLAVLGAEKTVFEANEAIIKNATNNEIEYRNRLIAVFTAEGKPLADRIIAGLALVTQLEAEGKISKELADKLREAAKQAGIATTATTGVGNAAATATPQLDAAAKKAHEMAVQTQAIANATKNASEDVLGLVKSLGKLPDWFTATGSKGATSISSLFGGGKADGGPVSAGTTYLVGERGPEMFVPGRSGSIVPMTAASFGTGGSGGGGAVQYHEVAVKIGDVEAARVYAVGRDLSVRIRGEN